MLWSRPKNLISWSSGIIYNSKFHILPPLAPPLPLIPSAITVSSTGVSAWVIITDMRTSGTEGVRDIRDWGTVIITSPLRLLPPPAACEPPDVFSCHDDHNECLLTSLLSVPWWRASCPRLQCASFAGMSLRMRNQFCSNVSINEMTCLWRQDNPGACIKSVIINDKLFRSSRKCLFSEV